MQTLRTLLKQIEEIQKTNPKWMDLPLIYSSDDEGNSFHKVHAELSEYLVEDINEHCLEPDFEYDEEWKVIPFEPNCICIN